MRPSLQKTTDYNYQKSSLSLLGHTPWILIASDYIITDSYLYTVIHNALFLAGLAIFACKSTTSLIDFDLVLLYTLIFTYFLW